MAGDTPPVLIMVMVMVMVKVMIMVMVMAMFMVVVMVNIRGDCCPMNHSQNGLEQAILHISFYCCARFTTPSSICERFGDLNHTKVI